MPKRRSHPIPRAVPVGADNFAISVHMGIERQRRPAQAKRLRAVEFSEDYQKGLSDALSGSLGDQVTWTDELLRHHARNAVRNAFADEAYWCSQVMLAVYLINPQSVAEIDRIVAEHKESRSGAFAPALYEGKGWNPRRALFFARASGRFWRACQTSSWNDWFAVKSFRKAKEPAGLWERSQFELNRRRGASRACP